MGNPSMDGVEPKGLTVLIFASVPAGEKVLVRPLRLWKASQHLLQLCKPVGDWEWPPALFPHQEMFKGGGAIGFFLE